jgi:hypothetical protein
MGDLIEERAAGRSALWLWGQTAAAIADTVARDLRNHWLLALRAIGTGWAASFLFGVIWTRVPWFGWWLEMRSRTLANFLFDAAVVVDLLIWPVTLGWIVAQTHRTQQAAMVLAFAASVAVCAPRGCIQCVFPDQADPSLVLGCSSVLCVLAGGLLPRLRRRTR